MIVVFYKKRLGYLYKKDNWRNYFCWQLTELFLLTIDGIIPADNWRNYSCWQLTELFLLTIDRIIPADNWQNYSCWQLTELFLLTIDGIIPADNWRNYSCWQLTELFLLTINGIELLSQWRVTWNYWSSSYKHAIFSKSTFFQKISLKLNFSVFLNRNKLMLEGKMASGNYKLKVFYKTVGRIISS